MLQEPDLEIEPQPPHPLYFIGRQNHPLAGDRPASIIECLSFPLAALSRVPPRVLEPVREAQRRSPDNASATRTFPAIECNSLAAVMAIVRNSDAVTASTLPCVAAELERGEITVLGNDPWLFLRYGLVRLKGHALSQTAAAFREFVLAAEQAIAIDEQRLIAKWATHGPGRSGTRRTSARPARR